MKRAHNETCIQAFFKPAEAKEFQAQAKAAGLRRSAWYEEAFRLGHIQLLKKYYKKPEGK